MRIPEVPVKPIGSMFLIVVFLLALVATCIPTNLASSPHSNEATKLRVALFPYLPFTNDETNEALRARLESEFETTCPDVDLELRKFDYNDDFYDPYWVAGLLKSETDIVEIDTMLLGALLDMEAIAPWPDPRLAADAHQIAVEAGRYQGHLYAIPHWMCGHFIVSQYESVTTSRSLQELIAALEGLNTQRPNLVGDLVGSWNAPAIYLDAWADTRSEQEISSAVGLPLDPVVLRSLSDFAAQGFTNGKNPCTNGDYHYNNDAAVAFGKGMADSLFGYSERLFYSVRAGADPTTLHITSVPLGEGTDPLWFVDSLVLRVYPEPDDALPTAERERYAGEIRKKLAAAQSFVAYLNNSRTFEWIHTSEDLGAGSPARYLIPASRSAFRARAFSGDPIMQQILPLLDRGTFFPRFNLPGVRRGMESAIRDSWSKN